MKVIKYMTTVDADVKYPPQKFAEEIAIYLADPDGWEGQGYQFVVGIGGKHIRLTSQNTLGTNGCQDDEMSCAVLGGSDIWLNYKRWMIGSRASKLPLAEYRQYMVTHEMGHSLGYEHTTCPGPGMPAPLMMQQTRGIGKCTPNTKLTQTDLKSKQ
jgi:hypothetical protein